MLRPDWQAASLNDSARLSYNAIIFSQYPNMRLDDILLVSTFVFCILWFRLKQELKVCFSLVSGIHYYSMSWMFGTAEKQLFPDCMCQ